MSISQEQTPNIQTSEADENRRKLIDSGAIHLIGSFPFDAMIAETVRHQLNSPNNKTENSINEFLSISPSTLKQIFNGKNKESRRTPL